MLDALLGTSSEEEQDGGAGGGTVEEEEYEEDGGLDSTCTGSLLSEVTNAVGSLRIEERAIDHRVWRVCDSVRSFVISVQSGSRGPLPNT